MDEAFPQAAAAEVNASVSLPVPRSPCCRGQKSVSSLGHWTSLLVFAPPQRGCFQAPFPLHREAHVSVMNPSPPCYRDFGGSCPNFPTLVSNSYLLHTDSDLVLPLQSLKISDK